MNPIDIFAPLKEIRKENLFLAVYVNDIPLSEKYFGFKDIKNIFSEKFLRSEDNQIFTVKKSDSEGLKVLKEYINYLEKRNNGESQYSHKYSIKPYKIEDVSLLEGLINDIDIIAKKNGLKIVKDSKLKSSSHKTVYSYLPEGDDEQPVVVFFATAEDIQNVTPTVMKVGRYLQKFVGYSGQNLEFYTSLWNGTYGKEICVKFARTSEEIASAYMRSAQYSRACMSKTVGNYRVGIHPCTVYGDDSDLMLAYVEDKSGNVYTRVLVNEKKKTYVRVYPNKDGFDLRWARQLTDWLHRHGYTKADGYLGDKIMLKYDSESKIAMPYVDGVRYGRLQGDFFIIGQGSRLTNEAYSKRVHRLGTEYGILDDWFERRCVYCGGYSSRAHTANAISYGEMNNISTQLGGHVCSSCFSLFSFNQCQNCGACVLATTKSYRGDRGTNCNNCGEHFAFEKTTLRYREKMTQKEKEKPSCEQEKAEIVAVEELPLEINNSPLPYPRFTVEDYRAHRNYDEEILRNLRLERTREIVREWAGTLGQSIIREFMGIGENHRDNENQQE